VDHSQLQKRLRTSICLDESILSVRHARQALEMNACRVINIKPVGWAACAKAWRSTTCVTGAACQCGVVDARNRCGAGVKPGARFSARLHPAGDISLRNVTITKISPRSASRSTRIALSTSPAVMDSGEPGHRRVGTCNDGKAQLVLTSTKSG